MQNSTQKPTPSSLKLYAQVRDQLRSLHDALDTEKSDLRWPRCRTISVSLHGGESSGDQPESPARKAFEGGECRGDQPKSLAREHSMLEGRRSGKEDEKLRVCFKIL